MVVTLPKVFEIVSSLETPVVPVPVAVMFKVVSSLFVSIKLPERSAALRLKFSVVFVVPIKLLLIVTLAPLEAFEIDRF